MKPVLNSNADRALWLAERRKGIGASEAPAVLGVSSYASPYSVAAVKQGLAVEDPETELTRWGRYVEAPMIKALVEETGWTAFQSGDLYRCGIAGLEFMQATLDGLAVVDEVAGGIECKLKIFHAREWEEDGVPFPVQVQCQHAMVVTGLPFFIVIGLLDGYRLRWKRIEYDAAFVEEQLVPIEKQFWADLQAGRPISAAIGDPDATAAALKARFPRDVRPEPIHLAGDHWMKHRDSWREAAASEKHWKFVKDQHKNALVAAIGEHACARLDDGTGLTLHTTDRAGYAVEPASFRVLREDSKATGAKRKR